MGVLVKQQQQIQQYYDATTAWFMRFGSTRKHGSIHRALYVDHIAVNDPTQVIHHMIRDAVMRYAPHANTLLDVGCGVGASMAAMGILMPQLVRRTGVTLSHVQATLGVESGNAVIVATFHALPYPDQSVDVVIAIESVIHSDQPELFWHEVQRVLRPGGVLIMCDDVLCDEHDEMIPIFQKGWHAPNLCRKEVHVQRANDCGLYVQESIDLTRYLRLFTVPLPIMRVLVAPYHVFDRIPLITSMLGSMALQHLLEKQAVAYTMLVFVRP
jgi:cyclopropane fatty-acyl-phospholipid synthase-like methyltransferase